MQPGDAPLQPSVADAPMPTRQITGAQIPQRYAWSDSTQRVQITADSCGIQPVRLLMWNADSLVTRCVSTNSAVADTAGESNIVNSRSFAATHGMPGSTLGPHTSRIFQIVMGFRVPVGHQ